MNQGMLILLLSLLSGGAGNTYMKGAGTGQPFKSGMGSIRPVTTKHMIRQMHEAIDALQRVEQISRLADFSTIKKKDKEGHGMPGAPDASHDHRDSYIGNLRESLSNIGELLGGADGDKRRENEDFYKQAMPGTEEGEVHESGHTESSPGGDGGDGNGISPEALISLMGNLMGNMNQTNGGNMRSNSGTNMGNSNSGKNANNFMGGNGLGNGIDLDKIMKVMNVISSFNNMNRK